MALIEYLTKQEIRWFPINIKMVKDETGNTKKCLEPYKETGYRPTVNDFFTLSNEELEGRKNYKYKYIAIDTSVIQQLDIDSVETRDQHQEQGVLDCYPYYLSSRKKLPHVFVKAETESKNKTIYLNQYGMLDSELLNGTWAWAERDAVVVNSNCEIGPFVVPEGRTQEVFDDYTTEYSSVDVKQILDLISPDVEYGDWIKIGMSLKNAGFQFDDWLNWSKRGDKFSQRDYCKMERNWSGFDRYETVKFGTLCYYAKTHSPEKWKEIKSNLLTKNEYMFVETLDKNENIQITQKNIGRLFFKQFKDEYVYDDGWFVINPKSGIIMDLSTKMVEVDMFGRLSDYLEDLLMKLIKGADTPEDKKKYTNMLMKTHSTSFLKGAFSFKESAFKELEFRDKLNSKPNIIGFKNGVYDIDTQEFRRGTKEDYVNEYNHFDWTDKTDCEFFNDFLYSLWEDWEMVKWFKKHLGSLYYGGNKEEKVYFWIGKGRNGKGTIDTLIKETLTPQYANMDISYFTSHKKGEGRPEPEVVKLKNKKIVMTTEPDDDVKLISSTIKRISGNDTLSARALYSNKMEYIKSDFKVVIQTNHKANFTDVDDGLLNRIVCIPFPFQFLDEMAYDFTNVRHRRGDADLKKTLRSKKMEFFNFIMTECIPLYRKEGINDFPPLVQEGNDEYRRSVDEVGYWVKTGLIETKDKKDKISTADCYDNFACWRNEECKDDLYSKDKFTKRLGSILNVARISIDRQQKRGIVGYKFATNYQPDNDFL